MTPIDDAASECGIGRTTIYRWIREGKLTKYERPLGRPRTFVDVREVRRLLEPHPVRRTAP